MPNSTTHYKGHTICVKNSGGCERLFVDDELQDEFFGFGIRSRMHGRIRDGEAAGEEVKVSLGGWWGNACRIFVDNRLIFHTKPDHIATQAIEKNTQANRPEV